MKILIIDDSPHIHAMIGVILKNEGYNDISHAYNGIDGFNVFLKINPDVIFLDNIMPKLNGIKVLEQIREIDKETIVIMLSSISNADFIIEAKILGINYYVLKPFLPDKIKSVIKRFSKLREEIQLTA